GLEIYMPLPGGQAVGVGHVDVFDITDIGGKFRTNAPVFDIHVEYIGHQHHIGHIHLFHKLYTFPDIVDEIDLVPVHGFEDEGDSSGQGVGAELPGHLHEQIFYFGFGPVADMPPDTANVHDPAKIPSEVYQFPEQTFYFFPPGLI